MTCNKACQTDGKCMTKPAWKLCKEMLLKRKLAMRQHAGDIKREVK